MVGRVARVRGPPATHQLVGLDSKIAKVFNLNFSDQTNFREQRCLPLPAVATVDVVRRGGLAHPAFAGVGWTEHSVATP